MMITAYIAFFVPKAQSIWEWLCSWHFSGWQMGFRGVLLALGSLQITCCDECLCCTRGTMVMALDTACWGVLSLSPTLPGDLGFSCHQVESRGSRKQWEIEAAVISEEHLFGRNLRLQIAAIKQNGLREWMVLLQGWNARGEETQEGSKAGGCPALLE